MAQLDDVSAELAEVLRSADRLLDEWNRFGGAVRAQVDREAATVGNAVAGAVDAAVQRGLAAQLATVGAEIHKLEQRARSASRALADQRAHDRYWLMGIAGGVAVIIGLLVALLVVVARGPAADPPRFDPPAAEVVH
jgi:ElaB/YqjD/DUF883 family membrane-anchored ribosome-binding protein